MKKNIIKIFISFTFLFLFTVNLNTSPLNACTNGYQCCTECGNGFFVCGDSSCVCSAPNCSGGGSGGGGGGGGCDSNNWGSWSSCSPSPGAGSRTRTNDCGERQSDSCCTSTLPTAFTLSNPLDNKVIDKVDFDFNWSNTSFGVSCNTDKTYTLYLGNGTDCSTVNYNITKSLGENIHSYNIKDLYPDIPAGNYCWYVSKKNSGGTVLSEKRKFQIITSTLIESTFNNDVCGNNITGYKESPSSLDYTISNPANFTIKYQYQGDVSPKYIVLGVGPRDVLNGSIGVVNPRDSSFVTSINTSKTSAYKIEVGTNKIFQLKGSNTPTNIKWIEVTDLNSQTSFESTLLNVGLNTSTHHKEAEKQVTAYFETFIKENFPEGRHYIYSYLLVQNSAGDIYVQGKTNNSEGYLYERTPINWAVDLTPPVVSLSEFNFATETTLSSPSNIIAPFTIEDTHPSDLLNTSSNKLNSIGFIESYFFKLKEDLPQQITLVSPTTGLISLELEKDFTGVNSGNGGHIFDPIKNVRGNVVGNIPSNKYSGHIEFSNTTTLGKRSGVGFKMQVSDLGCNLSDDPALKMLPIKPWYLVNKGNVSYQDNSTGLELPNVLNNTNNVNLKSVGINYNDKAVLTTEGLLQKTDLSKLPTPSSKVSLRNIYTSSYSDKTFDKYLKYDSTGWFGYLLNKIQILRDLDIDVLENTSIPNGGNILGSLLNSTIDTKKIYILKLESSLNIGNNVKCDGKSIVFVKNDLNLSSLKNTNSNSSCIFIVGGNINVNIDGIDESLPVTFISNNVIPYDILEGFFVTDGLLKIEGSDNDGNIVAKGEGVLVRGGVVAKDILIKRDINDEGNQYQPAFVVEYNPIYRELFRSYLSNSLISLREF